MIYHQNFADEKNDKEYEITQLTKISCNNH